MKRFIPPIAGKRIRLRLLEEADLMMTLAWRNQDHIRSWFIHSDIITPEQHTHWFQQYIGRDDDFVFVIEETQTLKKPIGQISLYRIDWNTSEAEFGRLMIGDEQATGRGLAYEATTLLVEFGFRELGLHHIYLEVFQHNTSAIAVYEKCGFQATESIGVTTQMSVFPNILRGLS